MTTLTITYMETGARQGHDGTGPPGITLHFLRGLIKRV